MGVRQQDMSGVAKKVTKKTSAKGTTPQKVSDKGTNGAGKKVSGKGAPKAASASDGSPKGGKKKVGGKKGAGKSAIDSEVSGTATMTDGAQTADAGATTADAEAQTKDGVETFFDSLRNQFEQEGASIGSLLTLLKEHQKENKKALKAVSKGAAEDDPTVAYLTGLAGFFDSTIHSFGERQKGLKADQKELTKAEKEYEKSKKKGKKGGKRKKDPNAPSKPSHFTIKVAIPEDFRPQMVQVINEINKADWLGEKGIAASADELSSNDFRALVNEYATVKGLKEGKNITVDATIRSALEIPADVETITYAGIGTYTSPLMKRFRGDPVEAQ